MLQHLESFLTGLEVLARVGALEAVDPHRVEPNLRCKSSCEHFFVSYMGYGCHRTRAWRRAGAFPGAVR